MISTIISMFLLQIIGELIFSLIGFPVMVVCLMYWAHVDRKERSRSNQFPLTSATVI